MMTRAALAVLLAVALSGCGGSETDTVRSGTGPSAASSSDVAAEPTEESEEPETSAEPATSSLLSVKGDFDIPEGEEGALSVVVIGTPDSGSSTVPVAIRNRTDQALSNLEVTGTARDAKGGLAGSGSSQGFAPETIQPGEWAVGYVYIDAKLNNDTEFDLTATGQEPDDFMTAIDVNIVEVSLTKGQFGNQLVGIVENPTENEVQGPISVLAGCFTKDGTLIGTPNGFTEADSVVAGGTSSFAIDLFDEPCEAWAIGASGYNY